jgi:hypothetical protein
MTLKDRLEKIKQQQEQNTVSDWEFYKEIWTSSISELQTIIMDKWFVDYKEKGLMDFSIIPIKKIDPYIGEYTSSNLEILLAGNKYLILEPISSVTSEYDGKLEFYMSGNVYKKVSILRKLNKNVSKWYVGETYDNKNHYPLNKESMEKLIDRWLQ